MLPGGPGLLSSKFDLDSGTGDLFELAYIHIGCEGPHTIRGLNSPDRAACANEDPSSVRPRRFSYLSIGSTAPSVSRPSISYIVLTARSTMRSPAPPQT